MGFLKKITKAGTKLTKGAIGGVSDVVSDVYNKTEAAVSKAYDQAEGVISTAYNQAESEVSSFYDKAEKTVSTASDQAEAEVSRLYDKAEDVVGDLVDSIVAPFVPKVKIPEESSTVAVGGEASSEATAIDTKKRKIVKKPSASLSAPTQSTIGVTTASMIGV